MERASKIAHAEVINNPAVVAFLDSCIPPLPTQEHDLSPYTVTVKKTNGGGIENIVALDGGYTETIVRDGFPSATVTFFTFGPLLFGLDDLQKIECDAFINPLDFAKLKQLQRHSLVLPTKNVCLKNSDSFVTSVRRTLFDYFSASDADGLRLMDAVRWLVFHRWENAPQPWILARCPTPDCLGRNILFTANSPDETRCEWCHQPVYLTDTFRLHEAIDEELGAGGILGYLMTLLEQILMVQWIKAIYEMKPSLLQEVLFVKDGPLAFFGQTANLHKPMRALMRHLLRPNTKGASVRMVGVEKTGAFVEHALALQERMKPGSALIPSNEYIYRYITPGASAHEQFGSTSYYSWKILFKDWDGAMYVLSIPTTENLPAPCVQDFSYLEDILTVISSLKCHLYENALVPVALVNRLVSLSNFPSSQLLRAFARDAFQGNGGGITDVT